MYHYGKIESEVICELNDLLILNYSSSMVEFRSEKFPTDSSSFNKGNAGETVRNVVRDTQTQNVHMQTASDL